MAHIPPEKLLPQDYVDIYDLGPVDAPLPKPLVIRMHASDAMHAMDADPVRYVLEVGHEAPPPLAVEETTEEPAETEAYADEEADDAEDDAREASGSKKHRKKK